VLLIHLKSESDKIDIDVDEVFAEEEKVVGEKDLKDKKKEKDKKEEEKKEPKDKEKEGEKKEDRDEEKEGQKKEILYKHRCEAENLFSLIQCLQYGICFALLYFFIYLYIYNLTGTYNCHPHIGIYHEHEGTHIKKQQQIIAQRRFELDNEANEISVVVSTSTSSSSPSTSAWLSRCPWKLPLVTPPLKITTRTNGAAIPISDLRQGQVPGKVV
jgi:hypothetical protein